MKTVSTTIKTLLTLLIVQQCALITPAAPGSHSQAQGPTLQEVLQHTHNTLVNNRYLDNRYNHEQMLTSLKELSQSITERPSLASDIFTLPFDISNHSGSYRHFRHAVKVADQFTSKFALIFLPELITLAIKHNINPLTPIELNTIPVEPGIVSIESSSLGLNGDDYVIGSSLEESDIVALNRTEGTSTALSPLEEAIKSTTQYPTENSVNLFTKIFENAKEIKENFRKSIEDCERFESLDTGLYKDLTNLIREFVYDTTQLSIAQQVCRRLRNPDAEGNTILDSLVQNTGLNNTTLQQYLKHHDTARTNLLNYLITNRVPLLQQKSLYSNSFNKMKSKLINERMYWFLGSLAFSKILMMAVRKSISFDASLPSQMLDGAIIGIVLILTPTLASYLGYDNLEENSDELFMFIKNRVLEYIQAYKHGIIDIWGNKGQLSLEAE